MCLKRGICHFGIYLWLMLAVNIVAGTAVQAQEKPRDQVCARWDELASEAIVHLASGKDELLVRQVGDAVFRMRRARRTCQLGWAQLACRDYRAIVQSAPGFSAASPHREFTCVSAFASITEPMEAADGAESTVKAPPEPGALTLAQQSCARLFALYPPMDEALGNTGGDPFAYHVFNREAELAAMRASSEACLNRTVASAER
jgi:hypothetical protein